MIVVEDLHWLDPSSLELIASLVERAETLADGTAGVWSRGSFFPLGSLE